MSQPYLLEHPPARDQFRIGRRERPSGVGVIHTAENTPDFVAFDGGAEAVAKWIVVRDTPGSYHDLTDSDSRINLVPYNYEAYQDGTGSNRHAWGGSVATRADVWPLAPKRWRDGAIRNLALSAADYSRWLRSVRGFIIPPRRITRAQSEARIPGFISHAERDPARREDPGKFFPWDQFFDEYKLALGLVTLIPRPQPQEEFSMIVTAPKRGPRHLTPSGIFYEVSDATRKALKASGVPEVPHTTDEFDDILSGWNLLQHR